MNVVWARSSAVLYIKFLSTTNTHNPLVFNFYPTPRSTMSSYEKSSSGSGRSQVPRRNRSPGSEYSVTPSESVSNVNELREKMSSAVPRLPRSNRNYDDDQGTEVSKAPSLTSTAIERQVLGLGPRRRPQFDRAVPASKSQFRSETHTRSPNSQSRSSSSTAKPSGSNDSWIQHFHAESEALFSQLQKTNASIESVEDSLLDGAIDYQKAFELNRSLTADWRKCIPLESQFATLRVTVFGDACQSKIGLEDGRTLNEAMSEAYSAFGEAWEKTKTSYMSVADRLETVIRA